jgi:hypothetical protein
MFKSSTIAAAIAGALLLAPAAIAGARHLEGPQTQAQTAAYPSHDPWQVLPAPSIYAENELSMVEILFSVCHVTDPARCKEERLSFLAESVSPHQCMTVGLLEIAKWSEAHPNWWVRRWTCGPAGRVAKA